MAIIEWTDELSVGIDMIDKQHMILIRAINLLALAVKSNSSNELMGAIFDTLADYTDTHFSYEEELFERYGYPETEEHKQSHKALLERVIQLRTEWEAGKATIGPEVLQFLVDWLKTHIMGTDKRYSAFLINAMAQQQQG